MKQIESDVHSIYRKIYDQGWKQIRKQCDWQGQDKVRELVGDPIYNQIGRQIRLRVWRQVRDQIEQEKNTRKIAL